MHLGQLGLQLCRGLEGYLIQILEGIAHKAEHGMLRVEVDAVGRYHDAQRDIDQTVHLIRYVRCKQRTGGREHLTVQSTHNVAGFLGGTRESGQVVAQRAVGIRQVIVRAVIAC